MDENTKIWNKKVNELTFAEDLLLHAAIPVVGMVAIAVTGVAVGAGKSAVTKFRTRKNSTEIETTN